MTAVPARVEYVATVQDAHGDIGVVRFQSHVPDISSDADTVAAVYTSAESLFTALAACMNVKIVEHSWNYHYSRAQKPTGPLSTYAHVYQHLLLNFGDGGTERMRVSIPGPKTTSLMTDGITANPGDTNVAALIAAIEAACVAQSNNPFNEYLGGRFSEGKPRRRTNQYNATA
jgi:hypothetical protein